MSRYQHIYLDNQPINKMDFDNTLSYLSSYFKLSIASIKYRIEELNLITYTRNNKTFKNILRSAFESILQ